MLNQNKKYKSIKNELPSKNLSKREKALLFARQIKKPKIKNEPEEQ